ncbi:uncharacterized protein [Physcomitrium patens]|uniref:Uncharacterized protein n=1 Tax=Physcomitrium patens TaxID=3218 RepID=A0A2K1JMA4_PHYPA|nr:heat shock 70 kDa protein 12A-like [Physcomitrium patens]PNR42667.1 hypothetical protein PHYPA_017497 [Physcomitrium patens]|eukprot:XP_024391964.1 heat shock 70 kDa protein 12A-like [Physcomitrella patens]
MAFLSWGSSLKREKCPVERVRGNESNGVGKIGPSSSRGYNDRVIVEAANPGPLRISRNLPSAVPGTSVEEVSGAVRIPDEVRSTPQNGWVIGLDFGTTFSGFAYAKVSDPEHIYVHHDWPCMSGGNEYCKTLTGLFYTKTATGELQCTSWGHPARSDYMANRGDSSTRGFYLSKFKLLLKKDLDVSSLASAIPPSLTVSKIITQYLKHIGEYALSVLRNHDGEVRFSQDSVQWCVTVPSIWDDAAKQQMKVCMMDTGLVSCDSGIESVKVVLEPEAASFHCHQLMPKQYPKVCLDRCDNILVADIGGGTVDIVVQKLKGIGRDYKVEELTESSGGLCGGTIVDDYFLRFVSKRIGCPEEFLRLDAQNCRSRFLKDWEEIKRGFGHEMRPTTNTEISLHRNLAEKWEDYERRRGYPPRKSYSEIKLTQQDMMSIFDPVVDEIIKLIAAQLEKVTNIKAIFVVGGFAGSQYLMRQIRARFSRPETHILSPPHPGSAIVKGAVALALNPGVVVARILKRTYGTSLTKRLEPGVDPRHLLKVAIDGSQWCRKRFDIFAKKGTRMEINNCVKKEYAPYKSGQSHIKFDLHSSGDEEPRYTDDPGVVSEGEFTVDLPKNPTHDNVPVYEFSLYFGRSSIELREEAKFPHIHEAERRVYRSWLEKMKKKQIQGESTYTLELTVSDYT